MKHLWGFIETTIDIAVPFVAMWLVYAVFVSPDWADPTFVLACSLFVASRVTFPAHYKEIGGVDTKPNEQPYRGR